LIGRGIWGKPWKLKELKEHAAGNEFRLDNKMIIDCALKHLNICLSIMDHMVICIQKAFTILCAWHSEAAALRTKLMVEESADVIKEACCT